MPPDTQPDAQPTRTLLVIHSPANSLGAVETFLKNRGWFVKSTSNLKEAMVFLVKKQPEFVMISIDHPNKKIRNLPRVLGQALPVCVIAFSESSANSSVLTLKNGAYKYSMFHPVTGPGVERMVNKYYKDQQGDPQSTSHFRNRHGSHDLNQSLSISIRGEASKNSSLADQNFLARLLEMDSATEVSGHLGEMHTSVQEGHRGDLLSARSTTAGADITSRVRQDPALPRTGYQNAKLLRRADFDISLDGSKVPRFLLNPEQIKKDLLFARENRLPFELDRTENSLMYQGTQKAMNDRCVL